ncbi:MAG: hypothetical protein K0R24_1152 [Gammaproteobacteria bacterium]|jgi:outer membrane immunogenic protein|nr:hypothetical protein [Gammaproteobacteria bacterium]MDF3055597.1 hypothetical protein [Gammaproteobacteria bacterium]
MKKHSQLSLLSAGVSVAALLLASTTGFAAGNYKGESYKGEAMAPAPCPVEKPLKDGFYVGAQVGYDSYRAAQNSTVASTELNTSHVTNATGFAGGLFAGYGQYFQDAYYLAAEILVNTSNANQTNNLSYASNTFHSKFSANTSYGARFLPGIKLNNSALFYVPLGYTRASLKGTTPLTSKSQSSGGFVYGVGIETAIYENFSLRGEYTHTNNNSFSSSGSGANVKWSPSDNQFMLGLLYHFA